MPRTTSLCREFAAIALGRQRPSAVAAAGYPVGERYSVANGPVSSILVPMLIVGLLGDIPLSLVVVAMCHPSHPMLIHAGTGAFGLVGLGWAVAARSRQRSMPHIVCNDALRIGGGIRLSGVIPKVAIERVLAIRGSRKDWMSAHGVARHEVLLASGLDPPNLALELKKTAWDPVGIASCQKLRPFRRWVLIYADKPAALATIAHSCDGT